MAYYLVYETDTGRLDSQGTVLASPLRANLTAVDVGTRPADNQMWNESSRTIIARPAKVLIDRLDDLSNDARFSDFLTAFQSLNTVNRQRLRNVLIFLLGSQRYRVQSEEVTL